MTTSPAIERVKRDVKTARKRERAARKAPPQVAPVLTDREDKRAADAASDWHTVGLRLTPEELAALDLYRHKGIVPLSRAESARALIRRALGLGRGSPTKG